KARRGRYGCPTRRKGRSREGTSRRGRNRKVSMGHVSEQVAPDPQGPPSYFAAFLDLRGRPCLVVGGGGIGLRKAEGLLAAGAAVTLTSPEARPELAELAARGEIRWERRKYAPGDARAYFLVIGAAGVPAVDRQVHADAEAAGRLCNIVD